MSADEPAAVAREDCVAPNATPTAAPTPAGADAEPTPQEPAAAHESAEAVVEPQVEAKAEPEPTPVPEAEREPEPEPDLEPATETRVEADDAEPEPEREEDAAVRGQEADEDSGAQNDAAAGAAPTLPEHTARVVLWTTLMPITNKVRSDQDRIRQLLDAKRVQFVEIDISMDAAARERMVAISGEKFIPQLHVHGQLIHGRSAMDELQELEDDDLLLGILQNGLPPAS